MADSTTDNNGNNDNAAANNPVAAPAAVPAAAFSAVRRLRPSRPLPPIFEISLNVVVSEPKIPIPNPEIAEQGRQLMKFETDDWRKVRYADIKRQFESAPPFRALEVNQNLETYVPKCKSFDALQGFDQTLGAITHGLLKQKKIMQSVIDSLPNGTKEAVENAFASPDSQYKKISDDLLQYVAGRRSHVIQQRRELFKPQDMAVRGALYAIPPSDTYLFEEPRHTRLVEIMPRGADHFIPNPNKCICCNIHKQRRGGRVEESEGHNVEDSPRQKRRRH